jgi:hypothetical protein
VRDLDPADSLADPDHPPIARPLDLLDPGDGAGGEEAQHRRPIVGSAIVQPQRHGRGRIGQGGLTAAAQLARRAAEQLGEGVVEPADTAKARGQGDLRHGQTRFVDQLLGEVDPAVLGDSHGRGAQMLLEQPTQLALAHAQALGQIADAGVLVQAALGDQA